MPAIGSCVGSIRLTSLLGRGGMGEVYLGFDETLHRRVAVKAIHGDRAVSGGSRSRFLHEARTLSSLRHPNICLVHDFVESDGENFLVMELIEGPTLSRALADGLTWTRKLEISIQVAEVLTIAHARGIVHRDLKPDNLMLTPEGQVKVLDFGIARVAESRDLPLQPMAETHVDSGPDAESLDTLPSTREIDARRTRAGSIVGTPGYMSPEQARGEEINPASDMYSFGLVLQRLFTEESPHEPGLSKTDLVARARRGESLPVQGVTGELAALIQQLKALQPEDRPTASQVLARLQRLQSRPARRRRIAAVALLLLVAGLAAIKYTFDLRHEREQALAARNEAEAARDQAQAARDQAEAVNDFLVELLGSADPEQTQGRDLTIREVLDRSAEELPNREDLEPSAKARFLVVTGHVYTLLGLLEEARSVLEQAVALSVDEPDIEGREHAQMLLSLGRVEESLGEYAAARDHCEQAAEVAARKIPDHLQGRASVLVELGNIQSAEGDLEGASASFEEALEMIRKVKGPDHPQTGMLLGNLANLAEDQGDCERAIALSEEALGIFEAALGPDHLYVATLLNNVAVCYEMLGRLPDAHDALTRALAIREQVLGPEHPDTGQTLINLASLQAARGQLDEAQQLLDRGRAVTMSVYGPSHPQSVTAQMIGVEIAEAREDWTAAEALAREAVATAATLEGHPQQTATAPEYLLRILLHQGKARDAVALAKKTLRQRRADLGEDHVWVASGWVDLAEAHLAAGTVDEARMALETAHTLGYDFERIEEPPALVDLAREVAAAAVSAPND